MANVWLYAIVSVIVVSLISLIGVFFINGKKKNLKKMLLFFVSFSAGTLLGDAFIHLLPEAVDSSGFTLQISIYLMLGILSWFVLEKFINWRHCHLHDHKDHVHPFAVTNLMGDVLHNFIDGLIIGASYLASVPLGIATTLAVIFHEIPQEIGEFAVLLRGGFTRSRALLLNFLSALTAVIGAIIALVVGSSVTGLVVFLIPFAAGSFIYIATADLIPELHKEVELGKSSIQLFAFVLGVAVMAALLVVG